MTNDKKYKTSQERAEAYVEYCHNHHIVGKGCGECPLKDNRICSLYWLDLEAKKEEKPLPCPHVSVSGECKEAECANDVVPTWQELLDIYAARRHAQLRGHFQNRIAGGAMITFLLIIYLGYIGVLKPGCLNCRHEFIVYLFMVLEILTEFLFIVRKEEK